MAISVGVEKVRMREALYILNLNRIDFAVVWPAAAVLPVAELAGADPAVFTLVAELAASELETSGAATSGLPHAVSARVITADVIKIECFIPGSLFRLFVPQTVGFYGLISSYQLSFTRRGGPKKQFNDDARQRRGRGREKSHLSLRRGFL